MCAKSAAISTSAMRWKAASERRPIKFASSPSSLTLQTGKHVWAERYDKAGTDPLALQDEVTGKIVDAIAADAGQIKRGQYHDAWGKDTADLGEYDYYLRGHDVFMNANSKEDNDRAGADLGRGASEIPGFEPDSRSSSDGIIARAGWNWWSDDIPADFRKAGELGKGGARQGKPDTAGEAARALALRQSAYH